MSTWGLDVAGQEGHLAETDQVLGGTQEDREQRAGKGHGLESSRGKEKEEVAETHSGSWATQKT